MTFYTNAAITSASMITRYGAAITVTHYGAATYDPTTGGATSTPSYADGVGVVFEYDQSAIDGTIVRSGDRRMFASLDAAPTTGDTLTFASGNYQIVSVKPLAPAGELVMVEMQLRGVGS